MPWGAIEWGCRVIDRVLEGVPAEMRRAQWMILFWTFWPASKWGLQRAKAPQDVIDAIESGMKKFETAPVGAERPTIEAK